MQFLTFAENGLDGTESFLKSESLGTDSFVKSEASNASLTDLSQFFPTKDNVQQTVFHCSDQITDLLDKSIEQDSRKNVEAILDQIAKLSPLEKLFLYLKLPTGKEYPDPLKQPLNPLGSRPEISQTIAWIKTHFKEDKSTSLPKQEVYDEYFNFCNSSKVKPLSTADFGKVMKQVYPSVRPRRLGTRGNSRYCYSGMTNRTSLPSPQLPKLFSDVNTLNKSTSTTPVCSDDANSISMTEISFMMSSKICKVDKGSKTDDKRKNEDELSRSSKTPPERCKGRKAATPLSKAKNAGGKKPRIDENGSGPSGVKLPIPRLPKIQRSVGTPVQTVKKQKPIQPKPSSSRESEFLENGNSLEQEEELLEYFRKNDDEPKVSQLRMLLERSKEDKCTKRRVSFETVPESPNSQKKFSFAPISPISNSPFAQPKTFSSPHRIIQRSNSVCSPMMKSVKKDTQLTLPPPQPVYIAHYEDIRSQSVPTLPDLSQFTPVPSDVADFTDLDTDSSNLLGLDESSNSLLVGANVDPDNLNSILNIIDDIEKSKPRSYPSTPTSSKSDPMAIEMANSKSYPCTPVQKEMQRNFDLNQILPQQPPLFEGTINLFDEGLSLDCEDTFNDLAREVTELNSDVI